MVAKAKSSVETAQPHVWDQEYRPVAEFLVGRSGVRTGQAAEVGKRAVDYVRGKDLSAWVLQYQDQIRLRAPTALPSSRIATSKDAAPLCSQLIKHGFIYRADRADLHNIKETSEDGEKLEKRKPSKWPKRLEQSETQTFDSKGFYVLAYEGSSSNNSLILFGVVAVVLFFCMFPAWPLRLKMATWYLSVVFMTLIFGLCVLRLILFIALWFCGVDFWLYPNLFADDLGFFDSFRPVYTWHYRNDDWVMITARIFCAFLSVGAIFKLGETHSIGDIGRFGKQQFLDIVDWGYQKLSNEGESDQLKSNQTGIPAMDATETKKLDPLLGEDGIHYGCMKKCQFDSYSELKEECLMDCDCATELIAGPCYRDCPEDVRNAVAKSYATMCGDAHEEEEDIENGHEEEESGQAPREDL